MNKTIPNDEAMIAPHIGSYVGTVDGHNAVLIVYTGIVEAYWCESTLNSPSNGFVMKDDAWDIEDGKFVALRIGEPVKVTFDASSLKFS